MRGEEDFVVETTLTGNVERRLFEPAQARGWQIYPHYVCLASVDDNVRRVEERFRAGGHFIPAETVARRYQRSLQTLRRVLPKADQAWLYDNSRRQGFDLVMHTQRGQILYLASAVPDWLEQVLSGG